MNAPKKDTLNAVYHSPSQLFSEETNNKIFSLLEPKTQALSTAIVCVVISRPPKHPEWKTFRTGVAILVKDHGRKAYFVQIFDIVDWEKLREEELSKETAYHVSMPNFHQMETSNGQAMGLKFSCESEAREFAQIARSITMTGQHKTDGCPAPRHMDKKNTQEELQELSETQWSKNGAEHSITPPEPPPPVIRDQSHSRPPRPASVYRNAPMAPPPPPPPTIKSTKSTPTSAAVGQDDVQVTRTSPLPAVNEIRALSPPSTPVSRNVPATLSGPPSPTEPRMTVSPPVSPHSTSTIDKRRSKSKRITKDMIGRPTNFQHVSHVGFDSEISFDEKALQAAVGEAVKRPSQARPPPPPPPPPPANRRNSNQPPPSEKIVRFVESNPATLDAHSCDELGAKKAGLSSEKMEGLSNTRDSFGAELEMLTAKQITEPESVTRINTPSGELMEELLDYIHGMPFDTHDPMVNNSSHSDNKRNSKVMNDSDAVLDKSNRDSELNEMNNSVLETKSVTPPPTLLESTSNDTSVTNYSTDKSSVYKTGEVEQESSKALTQKHCQNMIKSTIQDISEDFEINSSTEGSSEIINNLNEQKGKSVEITNKPVEIQSFQTIPEILITKDSCNNHSEDIKTEEGDCNDDNNANQKPSSNLELVAPSVTHAESDTALESNVSSSKHVVSDPPLESVDLSLTQITSVLAPENQIKRLVSSEQKTTSLSDPDKTNHPTDDNADPPQKPKRQRRKISRREISSSPSPPHSVTEL